MNIKLGILTIGIATSQATAEYNNWCNEWNFENPLRHIREKLPTTTTFAKKPVTVLLYGSARNDLLQFIYRNLQDLMRVGSNENINFLIHLDTLDPQPVTQRFIVMKNKLVQIGDDMRQNSVMFSSDPAALIDACGWAFKNFPSETTILILWNHGTGDCEPTYGKIINSIELFHYNHETKKIELNRSINFLDYVSKTSNECDIARRKTGTHYNSATTRGICYDNATKRFLTNHQVGQSLRMVSNLYLNGKPIDLVLCDACLMQGIGFAYSLKPYKEQPVARFMVGSQEVVLATGYAYSQMFSKMAQKPMSAEDFAYHVVQVFDNTYRPLTDDFTQSVIHLENIDQLYESINTVAQILIEGITKQSNNSVRKLIQKCSSRSACTSFEEPSYKDMHHLFKNMISNISIVQLNAQQETQQYQQRLLQVLNTACIIIKQVVIANTYGKNFTNASGIYIYVPEKKIIDPSFQSTDFARNNSWYQLLVLYLQNTRSETVSISRKNDPLFEKKWLFYTTNIVAINNMYRNSHEPGVRKKAQTTASAV